MIPKLSAIPPTPRRAARDPRARRTVRAIAGAAMLALTSPAFADPAELTARRACEDVPALAYVSDFARAAVLVYRIDPATGALLPSALGPFLVEDKPAHIVLHPDGRFVYVANWGAGTLSGFAIGRGGELIPVPGSPFVTAAHPESIAILPSGFLYVANYGDDVVTGFAIDPASGSLAPVPGSPFATGAHPISVAASPAGDAVYVANDMSSTVSAFAVDPRTGALSGVSGSPFVTGDRAFSVAVSPSGRFVYVVDGVSSDVTAFRRDLVRQGRQDLHPITGSPFATGANPAGVTVDPSGRFAFVANWGGGTVSSFRIDPVRGALEPVAGSPFASAPGTRAVRVDATGKFLYAANIESGIVSSFAIRGDGALRAIAGGAVATGGQPSAVVVTRRCTDDAGPREASAP